MPMIQNVDAVQIGSDVKVGNEWKTVSSVGDYRWGAPSHVLYFTDGSYRVVLDSESLTSRNYL